MFRTNEGEPEWTAEEGMTAPPADAVFVDEDEPANAAENEDHDEDLPDDDPDT